MQHATEKFPQHACQKCGSKQKLVETVIDDEFYWNPDEQRYEPHQFANEFEHTGNERCGRCREEWTGA